MKYVISILLGLGVFLGVFAYVNRDWIHIYSLMRTESRVEGDAASFCAEYWRDPKIYKRDFISYKGYRSTTNQDMWLVNVTIHENNNREIYTYWCGELKAASGWMVIEGGIGSYDPT